jgi:hypothetical protein
MRGFTPDLMSEVLSALAFVVTAVVTLTATVVIVVIIAASGLVVAGIASTSPAAG